MSNMVTEKDLEIEYHRDTGYQTPVTSSSTLKTVPHITFKEWLVEKYLKLRNKKPK